MDVKDGIVVKGTNFVDLREAGSAIELAERYYKEGTQLVMFDDDLDGIFVKKENANKYEVVPTGTVQIGDYLIKINDNGETEEIEVTSINPVSEESNVLLFSCEPQDWFIAGNYLVHNK